MTAVDPSPIPASRIPSPRSKRVLVVDDDGPARLTLSRVLQSFGHDPVVAQTGEEALEKLREEIDLVILDARMPGMNGFEVARRIRAHLEHFDLPIVMVTGLDSKEDRLQAVEVGVNDFISKPFDVAELRLRSAWLLKMKEATDALKQHRAQLELEVERRTAELRRALDETAAAERRTYEAHLGTIRRLVIAAEFKDRATATHIERIGQYCALIARGLGLPAEQVEILRYATQMHDVGKIGVPDAILLKQGTLTDHEWQIMKRHTTIGARILHGSTSPLLQVGEIVALSHHERWDGGGYPQGLSEEQIPLEGRICSVADVFDALTNERQYRDALPNETVYEMMAADRARHFDPRILDLFFKYRDEVEAIQRTFNTESP